MSAQNNFILTVKSLISAGKKIEAIKEVREVLLLGLRDAKDLIDACEAEKSMEPLTRVARNIASQTVKGSPSIVLVVSDGEDSSVSCRLSIGTFSCKDVTEVQIKRAIAMIGAAQNCDVQE